MLPNNDGDWNKDKRNKTFTLLRCQAFRINQRLLECKKCHQQVVSVIWSTVKKYFT